MTRRGTATAEHSAQDEQSSGSAEGSEQGLKALPDADGSGVDQAPIHSGNLNPVVIAAGSTITGCSDDEMKNFYATSDFVVRELPVKLADKWKEICKAARKVGKDGEKAAVVPIGVTIKVDQTNLLMHTTKITLTYAVKTKVESEIQEDLRQVQFDLT